MKNTIITAYDPEHNGCVVYELNTSSKEEAILKSIEVLDMHGYVPECGAAEDFLCDYARDVEHISHIYHLQGRNCLYKQRFCRTF